MVISTCHDVEADCSDILIIFAIGVKACYVVFKKVSYYIFGYDAGPVGFMGYGDLWGFNSIVLIFYKSRLGFMGIYITRSLSINPHKSP